MTAEEVSPVSLLEQARAVKSAKGTQCTISKLLSSTDPALELDKLIANAGDGNGEAIPYSVAASVISKAVGQKVDGQTISRHNRRRCNCP